jgi:hypothetical protein
MFLRWVTDTVFAFHGRFSIMLMEGRDLILLRGIHKVWME